MIQQASLRELSAVHPLRLDQRGAGTRRVETQPQVPRAPFAVLSKREILTEQRKHRRFAIQCAISFSGHEIFEAGTVANLSVGGCKITSKKIEYIGMYFALHIYLPDRDSPLKKDQASVRWAKEQEFGLEFVSMGPEEERLRGLVSTLESDTSN